MAKKKTQSMIILVLLLLGLTIGYAILSINLNINGTSTINKSTWDIHFENIDVVGGSVTPNTPATIGATGKTISYGVTLNNPGDYYEFTVDAKNVGTIDGMIESLTSTVNGQPPSSLPSYIEYFITYLDGSEIQENQLLSAGEKETYRVHIGFRRDISADQLPANGDTLNIDIEVDYLQSNNEAIPKPSNYWYSTYGANHYIGEEISGTLNEGRDYSTLIEDFCHPFFIRTTIINNIVTERYLGFEINGNAYYLRAGNAIYDPNMPDHLRYYYCDEENCYSQYYEDNKKILQRAFGASNCSENSGGYECSGYHLTVHIDNIGFVRIGDLDWYMVLNDDGTSGGSHNIGAGNTCYSEY